MQVVNVCHVLGHRMLLQVSLASVMEPVVDVELVGRIRPVYNNLRSFSLLNLAY